MTMAHVCVSAGCEPMNILCPLPLITRKRIIRVEVPVTTSLPTTVSLSSEYCFGEQATNDEDSNDSVTDLPLDGCTDSDFVTLPVLNSVDEPKRKKKKMCAPQPTMSLSIPGVQPNVTVKFTNEKAPKGKCALLKFLRAREDFLMINSMDCCQRVV